MRRHLLLLLVCLALISAASEFLWAQTLMASESGTVGFTILHTNDLHSHLLGTGPDACFTPEVGDGDPVRGHYARLATVIKEQASLTRSVGEPMLIFDSGDSVCGTLFQILGPSTATTALPEYGFFQNLGYDACGLGNHDFEAGEDGLVRMLNKASRGERMVPLVATNLILASSTGALRAHWNAIPDQASGGCLVPFAVKDIHSGSQTLRVGILGALGPDAAKLALANRAEAKFIGFDDGTGKPDMPALVAYLQERVNRLRTQQKADLVILLLHGGRQEEIDLAQGLKGLDIILAGHTHETYVRQEGQVWISQSGWRGETLNVLKFRRQDGKLTLRNPDACQRQIDDAVPADAEMLGDIAQYKADIDKAVSQSGFRGEEPVCLIDKERLRGRWPNNQAGGVVVDAVRSGINDRLEKPVQLYLSSYAMIRSDFLAVAGKPTLYLFSDVFRFSPLGQDESGRGGARVNVFYLKPAEVHKVLEAMHWFSRNTPAYEPVVSSNLTYEFSSWGVPLVNRVHNLKIDGVEFEQWPTLIRVAANEFLTRNLLRIKGLSGDLVDVSLRDQDGKPITVFPDIGLPPEHEILAHQLRKQFPPASVTAKDVDAGL